MLSEEFGDKIKNVNYPCNWVNYVREGLSYGDARNAARTDYRRLSQLHRDSSYFVNRNDKGVPPIVSMSAAGELSVPDILDYPRGWTPERIAAHREASGKLLDRVNRDPELGRWIAFKLAATASGCGESWQFGEDYNSGGTAYRAKARAIEAFKELGLDWVE
jgi:hypothetical protein